MDTVQLPTLEEIDVTGQMTMGKNIRGKSVAVCTTQWCAVPGLANASYIWYQDVKGNIMHYPAINTNYIISHCTTLQYNHNI